MTLTMAIWKRRSNFNQRQYIKELETYQFEIGIVKHLMDGFGLIALNVTFITVILCVSETF